MTVRRVMGAEIEFGISVPGDPEANPVTTSTLMVNAFAAASSQRRHTRWDYEEETPLRDARGYDIPREDAHPTQLTDDDPGMSNVILTNGARLYVDHAHPEYSSPEVTTPLDLVLWDKAGEVVANRAVRLAAQVPGSPPLVLYKNNTDNKGSSYGAHENYLVTRRCPFPEIVQHLMPFFVTRQVICGAGRVGIGQRVREDAFQISQRADFFEVEVGLETTLKRPIINTRDEPHADPHLHRRLHVIIGDANMSEVSTYLKVGTTALVLSMIEKGFITQDLRIDAPVAELHAVSHDPTLRHVMTMRDGRRMTALELQWVYLEMAQEFIRQGRSGNPEEQTLDVLARWESVLERLERDPMLCAAEIDWVAKLKLLNSYRERDNLDWGSPKLQLIDLQYSDIRPEKGLYHRLAAAGRMERLLTDEQIARAAVEPPEETRAWFRGQCMSRFGDEVVAASWDSVIFDIEGRRSLQRVPTSDPLRGTRAHVGELFDRSANAAQLLAQLQG